MQSDFHPKYVRRRMKMLLREQRKRLTWRMVCPQAFHIPAHVYLCEGLVLVSQKEHAPLHVPGPAA